MANGIGMDVTASSKKGRMANCNMMHKKLKLTSSTHICLKNIYLFQNNFTH